MANDWTSEMQAQFDALKQDIQAQFDNQTKELTRVITTELQKRLSETEERLSAQYRTAVEAVRGEVRLAAEAWGGSLEGIQRDLRTLNEKFDTTIEIHATVLAEHSRDIAMLKRGRRRV